MDHNEFDKEAHCESLLPRLYESAWEAMKYLWGWDKQTTGEDDADSTCKDR